MGQEVPAGAPGGESWFPRQEYVDRVGRVQARLREGGLDGLLVFEPESVTYLTGFFTTGYFTLQFVIVPYEGEPTIVCRDVEEYYLNRTAVFPRRILWSDGEETDAVMVRAVQGTIGDRARVGLEKTAWQMTAKRYDLLRTGLPAMEFVDASGIVGGLRLIKSPREVEYQRRAARIAEAGMRAAAEAAKAGERERDLAAVVSAAMVRAGNDRPTVGCIGSGDQAHHVHATYSDRVLRSGDTVQVEVTPCYRWYHARFMRPIKIGRLEAEEAVLARRLVAIQDRAIAAVAPGVPARIADRIYREGILSTGAVANYTNKTFYSVGLQFPPNAGEVLDVTPASDWSFEAGMTFHTYLIVRGLCFSETILVTPAGCEILTHYPREVIMA